MHGEFDYNQTPLAPIGTRVIVHENSQQRGTYGPHGVDGWYVGPGMEHYRCYTCYISKTGGERHSETVDFFPKKYSVPNLLSREIIHSAALDLIKALKTPHPPSVLNVGNEQLRALETLTEIFQQTSKAGEIVAPLRVDKYKTQGPRRPFGNIPSPKVPTTTDNEKSFHPKEKYNI